MFAKLLKEQQLIKFGEQRLSSTDAGENIIMWLAFTCIQPCCHKSRVYCSEGFGTQIFINGNLWREDQKDDQKKPFQMSTAAVCAVSWSQSQFTPYPYQDKGITLYPFTPIHLPFCHHPSPFTLTRTLTLTWNRVWLCFIAVSWLKTNIIRTENTKLGTNFQMFTGRSGWRLIEFSQQSVLFAVQGCKLIN